MTGAAVLCRMAPAWGQATSSPRVRSIHRSWGGAHRGLPVHHLYWALDRATFLCPLADRVRGIATFSGEVDADLIAAWVRLEIIAAMSIGLDHVDLAIGLMTTRYLVGEHPRRARGRRHLINIAHGSVVDQTALGNALAEHRKLAGAGLDVFEKESHVPETLTRLGNVVLTPHVGNAAEVPVWRWAASCSITQPPTSPASCY
ncbi:MAG: hypothetical protein KGJ66_12665 [Alphaproteobacteria bacterium]|nr:hypothetical protein [Alphaproteobacteria bacterium]